MSLLADMLRVAADEIELAHERGGEWCSIRVGAAVCTVLDDRGRVLLEPGIVIEPDGEEPITILGCDDSGPLAGRNSCGRPKL